MHWYTPKGPARTPQRHAYGPNANPARELGLTVTTAYESENGGRSALGKLLADAGAGATTELFISIEVRLGGTVDPAPRHMDAFVESGATIHIAVSGPRSFADLGMRSLPRTRADFEDEHTESRPSILNACAKLSDLVTARSKKRSPSQSETP